MAKFYAVKEGKKPGIYMSWDECKEQVNGYSGAVYKSFTSEDEAKAFIGKEVKLCSTLGSTWFYVLLVVVLMFLKDKKELLIGIHLLIGQGINRLIKYIIKRPRPPQGLHLVKETNYSFPSGHSMSAMIGYGLLIIEVYQSSLKYKKLIMTLLAMMILLIGLSRIYLGVHYFSDVIGGFLLSLSYLLFIYYNTSLYT